MTRGDFQKLAILRLEEAEVLLDGGKPDGAYYLAGYAVECALKACIAKRTRRFEFPVEPGVVRDYYTHNLESLLKSARLRELRDAEGRDNSRFLNFWVTVRDWSEASRYERWTRASAKALVQAVADPTDGVLAWIKRHW